MGVAVRLCKHSVMLAVWVRLILTIVAELIRVRWVRQSLVIAGTLLLGGAVGLGLWRSGTLSWATAAGGVATVVALATGLSGYLVLQRGL